MIGIMRILMLLLLPVAVFAAATTELDLKPFNQRNLSKGETQTEVCEPVAPKDAEITPVLGKSDKAIYAKALRDARAGRKPGFAGVRDTALKPTVEAEYLLGPAKVSYADMVNWLEDNLDHPQTMRIYEAALIKRPVAHSVCKTTKVKRKLTAKQKKKGMKPYLSKRSCHTEGSTASMPPKPMVLVRKEQARMAAERARESKYDLLSPELASARKKLAGEVWRLRSRKQFEAARTVLLRSGSRQILGDADWQGELVKLADAAEGQRDWRDALKSAAPAASVDGPDRDTALWLAGMAEYRLGDKRAAMNHWRELVKSEPARGKHLAQAGFWGARAARALGERAIATELLTAAAEDSTNFYGILAAEKLGKKLTLDWQRPPVFARDWAALLKIDELRAGFALAELGETGLAQNVFRYYDDKIPYQAESTLAAVALKLHLPAVALQAGRRMLEQGKVLPAALYPEPTEWKPRGAAFTGDRIDRALMLGIMRQESAFHPSIGSRVGAQGLMQLMPATARYTARMAGRPFPAKADLHDPATNLTLAQDYLAYLNGEMDGNLIQMVAAYNGGMGSVRKWLKRTPELQDDPALFVENIAFDETRDYVKKVMANVWIYESRGGRNSGSLHVLAANQWPSCLPTNSSMMARGVADVEPAAGPETPMSRNVKQVLDDVVRKKKSDKAWTGDTL